MQSPLVVKVVTGFLAASAVCTPVVLYCDVNHDILGFSDLAPGLWAALVVMIVSNFYIDKKWSPAFMALAALTWWIFSAQSLRSNCHESIPGPAIWIGWTAISISAWTHRN